MFNFTPYTLHFDGSHTNQFQKSGAGCIIRDNKGDLVVAASYNLGASNPEFINVAIAEAIGLLNGLKLAQSFGIKLSIIKGDNKEVINHVRGQASRAPKLALKKIIDEIKAALSVQNIDLFSQIQVINREGNQVADSLASEGSGLGTAEQVYRRIDELPLRTAKFVEQEKSLYDGGAGGGAGRDGGSGFGEVSRLVSQTQQVYRRIDELPLRTANLVVQEKSSYGGGAGGAGRDGGGGFGEVFRKFVADNKPNDYGSSSNNNDSMVDTIAMAGASIAGVAVVGWGLKKLFFGSNSNDQPQSKTPLTNSNLDNKLYVLNIDGLDSKQCEQAAAGCIIRDRQGELVIAAAYNLNYCYPYCHIGIAEAMALKKGLELAKEHNIRIDVIEGDNKEVIDRVLGHDIRPPKEPKMIETIQEIRDQLEELSIDPKTQLKLVPSEDNRVADALAKVGRNLIDKGNKYYYKVSIDIPREVADLIRMEKH